MQTNSYIAYLASWRAACGAFLILFVLAPAACFAEFPGWIETEKIRGTYDFHHVDSRAHLAKLAAEWEAEILLAEQLRQQEQKLREQQLEHERKLREQRKQMTIIAAVACAMLVLAGFALVQRPLGTGC